MKLVILDRNGTINAESEDYIKSPEEWVPLPGALDAIARLNHAGFHVVVAANLAGLGRGLYDVAALNAIHARMHKQLAAVGGRIDAVFFCPHSADEGCSCRKPMPGMLYQAQRDFHLDLTRTLFVGDDERDRMAAVAAGCKFEMVGESRSFNDIVDDVLLQVTTP